MPDLVVRVGTRSSHLALWQANHVIERLEGAVAGPPRASAYPSERWATG